MDNEAFVNLRGLEGLYVFVNHPARVKVSASVEGTFDRLMRESAAEMQLRHALRQIELGTVPQHTHGKITPCKWKTTRCRNRNVRCVECVRDVRFVKDDRRDWYSA
jgi:hypothetical protein